jgi:hypothetical protein
LNVAEERPSMKASTSSRRLFPAVRRTRDPSCSELYHSSLNSKKTKPLTEQAIAELSASNDKLKAECERAWREVETWKKTCQSAGLEPKKEIGGGDN